MYFYVKIHNLTCILKMKEEYRIVQQTIRIDLDHRKNHLLLVVTDSETIIGVATVPIPDCFEYLGSNCSHYPVCIN